MSSIFSSCTTCVQSNDVSSSERTIPHFINKYMERIHCRHWHPTLAEAEVPRALVYICHGFGEHCGKYEKLVKILMNKGFFVFSNDHVGHGHSEGCRAHIRHFKDYQDDVVQYVNLVKDKFKHINIPTFAIGHSMGGTVVIMTILDFPNIFNGIILIAPAVVPDPRSATPIRIKIAKCMAFLRPQYQVAKIKPDTISRDSAVVADYENDPLVYHGGLKARFCVEMLCALERLKSHLKDLRVPLLLLHGDKDVICSLEGSQLLHDMASSTDKTLEVYKGALHQVHNEIEPMATDARNEMASWILKRTSI